MSAVPDPRAALVLRTGASVIAVIGPLARPPREAHPEDLARAAEQPPATRGDFLSGRRAAALGLAALGTGGPVPRGPQGRPLFPAGTSGSISHCDGWAVCVVREGSLAVGVDLERIGRVPAAGLRHVCTPDEREWVCSHGPDARPEQRMAAIFSAKEAVYKAQHAWDVPRRGYLGIGLRPRPGGFVTVPGTAARPLPRVEVTTRWLGHYVLTHAEQAAHLPAGDHLPYCARGCPSAVCRPDDSEATCPATRHAVPDPACLPAPGHRPHHPPTASIGPGRPSS